MKNKKFIEELKEIVNDGTILKSDSFEKKIRRFPNNIIMIGGRSISWADLHDLLTNGDVWLDIKGDQKELFKQSGRGGRRVGSGRKTIPANQKNKVRAFSLSPDAIQTLDTWLAENVNAFYEDGKQKKMTASLIIDRLIKRNLR